MKKTLAGKYLTVPEIAELLGVSAQTVSAWIFNPDPRHKLEAFRVGNIIRVEQKDFEEFLANHKVGPTA